MIFLFVHFGKNRDGSWRFIREIYSGLSEAIRWNWINVSQNSNGFREWLRLNEKNLKRPGVSAGFGNHRKFQSLSAISRTGTGAAVDSYIKWIDPPRTHEQLFMQQYIKAKNNPKVTFDLLFQSMGMVTSFGRLAKFDYLTMVGKLELAPIIPGSPYIKNSSGPLKGAKLLFFNKSICNFSPITLEKWLIELGEDLDVNMQVIEDSLCNWQKSPDRFIKFHG